MKGWIGQSNVDLRSKYSNDPSAWEATLTWFTVVPTSSLVIRKGLALMTNPQQPSAMFVKFFYFHVLQYNMDTDFVKP